MLIIIGTRWLQKYLIYRISNTGKRLVFALNVPRNNEQFVTLISRKLRKRKQDENNCRAIAHFSSRFRNDRRPVFAVKALHEIVSPLSYFLWHTFLNSLNTDAFCDNFHFPNQSGCNRIAKVACKRISPFWDSYIEIKVLHIAMTFVKFKFRENISRWCEQNVSKSRQIDNKLNKIANIKQFDLIYYFDQIHCQFAVTFCYLNILLCSIA